MTSTDQGVLALYCQEPGCPVELAYRGYGRPPRWCDDHYPSRAPARLPIPKPAHEVPAPRSGHPDTPTLPQARARRDEAVARVSEHAGEDWNVYARAWVQDYLATHREFFPDDLWAEGLREPHDRRAMGAIVKWAAREGLIQRTGERRPRTLGHATFGDVWRSLIVEDA